MWEERQNCGYFVNRIQPHVYLSLRSQHELTSLLVHLILQPVVSRLVLHLDHLGTHYTAVHLSQTTDQCLTTRYQHTFSHEFSITSKSFYRISSENPSRTQTTSRIHHSLRYSHRLCQPRVTFVKPRTEGNNMNYTIELYHWSIITCTCLEIDAPKSWYVIPTG